MDPQWFMWSLCLSVVCCVRCVFVVIMDQPWVAAENAVVPYLYLSTQSTTSHRLHKINKEELRSLLIAEELWRVSLLKYHTPNGKHSSVLATIMALHASCLLTHWLRMFVFGP